MWGLGLTGVRFEDPGLRFQGVGYMLQAHLPKADMEPHEALQRLPSSPKGLCGVSGGYSAKLGSHFGTPKY